MKSLLIVLLLFGIYWTPFIIARIRNVPNHGSVLVINFFLGWTLIGWVVALAMAARDVPGAKGEHGSFRLTK